MAQFRKRPVVVEAFQLGLDKPPPWYYAALADHRVEGLQHTDAYVYLKTNHGYVRAEKGDWIIKQVDGEVYPCKHAVFLSLYEEVKERAPVLDGDI